MKQQDQSRKEFEMWARESGYQRDELARCSIGIVGPEYFNLNTEGAWQAWQAARVSLEAAQKDAARYQWIAKQKHIWAVLGDRYNMPEIDEGATTFEESIDIAMASQS